MIKWFGFSVLDVNYTAYTDNTLYSSADFSSVTIYRTWVGGQALNTITIQGATVGKEYCISLYTMAQSGHAQVVDVYTDDGDLETIDGTYGTNALSHNGLFVIKPNSTTFVLNIDFTTYAAVQRIVACIC